MGENVSGVPEHVHLEIQGREVWMTVAGKMVQMTARQAITLANALADAAAESMEVAKPEEFEHADADETGDATGDDAGAGAGDGGPTPTTPEPKPTQGSEADAESKADDAGSTGTDAG